MGENEIIAAIKAGLKHIESQVADLEALVRRRDRFMQPAEFIHEARERCAATHPYHASATGNEIVERRCLKEAGHRGRHSFVTKEKR